MVGPACGVCGAFQLALREEREACLQFQWLSDRSCRSLGRSSPDGPRGDPALRRALIEAEDRHAAREGADPAVPSCPACGAPLEALRESQSHLWELVTAG